MYHQLNKVDTAFVRAQSTFVFWKKRHEIVMSEVECGRKMGNELWVSQAANSRPKRAVTIIKRKRERRCRKKTTR